MSLNALRMKQVFSNPSDSSNGDDSNLKLSNSLKNHFPEIPERGSGSVSLADKASRLSEQERAFAEVVLFSRLSLESLEDRLNNDYVAIRKNSVRRRVAMPQENL